MQVLVRSGSEERCHLRSKVYLESVLGGIVSLLSSASFYRLFFLLNWY